MGLRSRVGVKKGIKKDNVRLCEIGFQVGLLFTEVCNIKKVRNKEIKNKIGR